MNETKEMINEIKGIIDGKELSKEDIESLKQTLAMLKANTEKSLVEDLVDGNEQTIEALKEKAEELSTALDKEKNTIQTTTPTADELVEKEAKIDSLQDALIKVVGMRDSMTAGKLKDAIYNLLRERKEEIENLVEPCLGSILAESGIEFGDFSEGKNLTVETINESQVSSILYNILMESNSRDAVFEAFTNNEVKEQIKKCYEIRRGVDEAGEELNKEAKNAEKLQNEIKRLRLMQQQKTLGISPSMLTESAKEKMEIQLDKLHEKYKELEAERHKISKNLFLEIIFSKKLKRIHQEESKIFDSEEHLRQKLTSIEEIKKEAKGIGIERYTEEDKKNNLQEYIEYASKINPESISALLIEKGSKIYDHSRGITIEQNQKYNEYLKLCNEYRNAREKLPSDVEHFISNRAYERFGFNPFKLLVTQDKEVISSLLVGTSIFYKAIGKEFKQNFDVYQIAEKYNEVKARHEAKKQAQQQNMNNQNVQTMQAGMQMGAFQNNLEYIGEFIEEESQGMKM